jgi:hypothetical protein
MFEQILWMTLGGVICIIGGLIYSHFKTPKTCGVIFMHDADSMYVELNDSDILEQMYKSDYVMFKVKRPQK